MGVVFPLMVVTALFIVGNGVIINVTEAPPASSTDMTVDATGHQWWWEFRYPGAKAVTADELHIPVRTRVNLVATTADVIHSFWVPELTEDRRDPGPAESDPPLREQDGRYRGTAPSSAASSTRTWGCSSSPSRRRSSRRG